MKFIKPNKVVLELEEKYRDIAIKIGWKPYEGLSMAELKNMNKKELLHYAETHGRTIKSKKTDDILAEFKAIGLAE